MEAELAVLKDLGYDIDLQNQFGFSVYESNTYLTNTTGFSARNADGTGWLPGVYNLSTGAIGLHVYGAGNTVVQAADILSAGYGSAGIRIDGTDLVSNFYGMNSVTVDEGVRVHAHGADSAGVLVSYGKHHVLVNRGEIAALGSGGIGVRFDFGDNLAGNDSEYRGSWMWTDSDGDNLLNLTDEGLDGALVDRFDVTGTVAGNAAAIYIAENALVERINIMNGAQLYGDIISDWNPNDPRVQIPSTYLDTTILTFGWLANAAGEAIYTPDPDFSLEYRGNILGKEGLDVVLAGGELIWQGVMDVNEYQQDSGTTLIAIIGDGASSITADEITLEAGSSLGVVEDGSFRYGEVYGYGGLPVLSFDANYFENDAAVLHNSGTMAVGAYDYTFDGVRWLDGQTLGVDITGRRFNHQRGGTAAVTGPVALAAHNGANSAVIRRSIERFSLSQGSGSGPEAALLGWANEPNNLMWNNRKTAARADSTANISSRNRELVQWRALASGATEGSLGLSSIWMNAGYGYASQSGRVGYDIYGPSLRLGYDAWISDNVFLGLAVSLELPEFDSDDADIEARNVTGSLYGGVVLPWRLELGAFGSYGHTSHDLKRSVHGHRYSSSYGADTWSAGLHAGRSFALGSRAAARPFVSYEYMHLDVDGYNEGSGLYALDFASSSNELHRVQAGTDLSWTFLNGSWISGRAFYSGLYGDREGSTSAFFSMDPQSRSFTSTGDALDKHSLGLGLGAGLPISKDADLTFGYTFIGGKDTSTHMLEVGLQLKF